MGIFEGILKVIIGYGWSIQVVGLSCFFLYWRFQRAPRLDPKKWPGEVLPGVTIIKPCLGAQDDEKINFDHFFNQDYPGPIQILFSVSSETDLAVEVIQHFLKKYPHFDAECVVSKTRRATLMKFDALYDAQLRAKHEVIIWSDADVVVKPGYVSQMVASLQDPGVGLVTTPQFDSGMSNVMSAVKGLSGNADVATLVMIYNAFKPVKMGAWGHSMGFRKSVFDRFSDFAWKTLDTFIVDDQALPYIFNKQGLPTVFRNIYCPAHWNGKTFKQIVQQKKSWGVFQLAAIGNRWLFLSGVALYPVVFSVILMLATGFSAESLWIAFLVLATRILAAGLGELLYLGSVRMTAKFFWTIPIWDLMQPYFMWIAFRTKRLVRHGKAYTVEDRYFLRPVSPGKP